MDTSHLSFPVAKANPPSSKPTFAEKTKSKIAPLTDFEYPDEKQAIIFKHIENVKILDYLKAFLSVIPDPKAIIAASRVSNNRVIIFLDSADRVQSLLNAHKSFQVGDKCIPIYRLRPPISKIVLSNVSPTIPNSVLQEYLTKYLQLECTSPISILRVNPSDELFAHVISWRRQVYVKHKPDWKPPPSFSINYNNRIYRIFITNDEFTCFKCHQNGHKAEDCHKTVDLGSEGDWTAETDLDSQNNLNLSSDSYPPLHSMPIRPSVATVDSGKEGGSSFAQPAAIPITLSPPTTPPVSPFVPPSETAKRRLSDSSLGSSLPTPHQALKKSKEETSSSLSGSHASILSESEDDTEETADQLNQTLSTKQIFEPLAKYYQENQNTYPLSFQNFMMFMDMCKGKQNVEVLLNEFCLETKIKDLVVCLKECRQHIKHSSTKGRMTRLYKKLDQLRQLPNPPGLQSQQLPGSTPS